MWAYAEVDKELAARKMANPTAADISRVIIDIGNANCPIRQSLETQAVSSKIRR